MGNIALGVGANGYNMRFADLNGDGRADYLSLRSEKGAVTMWYNGCSSDGEGGGGGGGGGSGCGTSRPEGHPNALCGDLFPDMVTS